MRRRGRLNRGEKGLALVAVLLVIALLSLIAVGMLRTGRVSSELAHLDLEHTQTEAVLQAGVARAILALVDPRIDHRWRIDGVAYDVLFGGTHLTVGIQDELGKIDINNADGSLLVGLFVSAGIAPDAAPALVDKILDWRDKGDGRRANGAKRADYQAAGYEYGPRNGPFQSVDELLLVMGMTTALFRRVKPALTVYWGVNISIRRPPLVKLCWRCRAWMPTRQKPSSQRGPACRCLATTRRRRPAASRPRCLWQDALSASTSRFPSEAEATRHKTPSSD